MSQKLQAGSIVRFKNPRFDEDPFQLFIIGEIHYDVERPRCTIKEADPSVYLPATFTVLVEDLELAQDAFKAKLEALDTTTDMLNAEINKVADLQLEIRAYRQLLERLVKLESSPFVSGHIFDEAKALLANNPKP